jgi:hypothetical protein
VGCFDEDGGFVTGLPNYWHELIERAQGPMRIRLVLQPIMAALFATRAGLRDAREGRPLYFWAFVRAGAERKRLAAEGWKHVGGLFMLSIGIDLVYQAAVLHAFRPGEAVFLGVVLAIVPYLIFRGVVNRILRRRFGGPPGAI